METHVSATVAARTFSELLNRVRYRGEEFVVERGGKPVCRIVPAGPQRRTFADLASLLEVVPAPDDGYFAVVEQALARQPRLSRGRWGR